MGHQFVLFISRLFLLISILSSLTACEITANSERAPQSSLPSQIQNNESLTDNLQPELNLSTNSAIKNISVMAYNVENLFDTEKDEDRNDWAYQPLSYKQANAELLNAECAKMSTPFFQQECLNMDWNDQVLKEKMTRVADTILQINGRGPDVLILSEVENIRVIEKLNKEFLSKAGYKTVVLIEGGDRRGIDIGILSRFPLVEPARIHAIEFTPDANNANWQAPNTRGIMEAAVKLPTGQTLYVLGFHFPSQSNPVQQRIDAIQSLNKIMTAKGPSALVVAGGDSNITLKEEESLALRSKALGSVWSVSHLVGCKDCEGTHYYKGKWDYLDILLFSPALTSMNGSVQLDATTISVPKNGKYQLNNNGTPARFDIEQAVGVSDHLPIYGEVVIKK